MYVCLHSIFISVGVTLGSDTEEDCFWEHC